MPPRIAIQNNLGLYTFHLNASNGESLLHSDKFSSVIQCLAAARQFQQSSHIAERYEKIDMPTGQYCFVVKGDEGKIIATSDNFWSIVSRNYAMTLARKECVNATIDDGQPA